MVKFNQRSIGSRKVSFTSNTHTNEMTAATTTYQETAIELPLRATSHAAIIGVGALGKR